MTTFDFARERDERVLTALENWRCLDLYQISVLFFPNTKIARKRMLELYRKKKVKRVRLEVDQPNIYFISSFDEKTIQINWARIYLEKKRASGETPINFDYDTLILTYENPITKQRRQTRIETGKIKLSFGNSVFFLDSKKLKEIKEALL